MEAKTVGYKKQSGMDKFLNALERMGNKLPDPLILFVWIAVIILVASAIVSSLGVSVVHPTTGKTIKAVNLLSVSGFQKILKEAVNNFTSFPALGLLLTCVIGVGLGEKTGLYEAFLRKTLFKVKSSQTIVVALFTFIGILANAAGDSGYVIMPTLGAMIFPTIGLSPIAGIVVGYTSVAGGLSANVIIALADVLCASIATPAARIIDPNFVLSPACNYYFITASTFILVFVSTWITIKIVGPRTSKWLVETKEMEDLTSNELRGLKWAKMSLLIFLGMILLMTIPQSGWLRHPESKALIAVNSPLMEGIVPLTTLFFFIPSLAFGKATGKIKNGGDLSKLLAESMGEMGMYIVTAFVIAQFVAFFSWSNMGIILAVKGANFLKNLAAPIPVIILIFILITSIINLLIGSILAKWAMFAPVFVPMFMLLGIHPAMTEAAYRIGDSVTNCITPLLPYIAIVMGFAKKYDEKIGLGTLISNMMPYSIGFLAFWTALLMLWYFLGLPLGPGGPILL